jgi:preprotein translocase subunit SecG
MKNTLKTFFYWVILFFTLLIGIYILISYQYIVIAKFTGVLTVIFFISALKIWTTNSKKKNLKLKKTQLNLNHRYWLSKNCPFYY